MPRPFLMALMVFFTLCTAIAAPETAFRVAVLHGTYASGRHSDEFDGALRHLGWTAEKFASTREDLEKLAASLDRFDLLLGCPLFNYEPAQDMIPYVDQLRAFVRDGGAIALTDGNYPQVFSWLALLDPSMKAETQTPCKPDRPPGDETPLHPLRSMPNRLREDNTWAHLSLPPDSPWEVVLRCGDGHPVTVVRRFGRGFVYLTSLRQPNAATLGNLRACLALQRLGWRAKAFAMSELALGAGELSLRLARETEADTSAAIALTVQPRIAGGHPQCFATELHIQAGKTATVTLPYRIDARGLADVSLTFETQGQQTLVFARTTTFPEILSLRPAIYRGLIAASRRTTSVVIAADVNPGKETVAGYALDLSVIDGAGKAAGSARRDLETTRVCIPVPLAADAPHGRYAVRGRLTFEGQLVAEASTGLTVLAPTANQVVIDGDLAVRVDDAPFFPLGLYHVSPADLPAAASLGINLVQVWDWDGIAALDQAQALGLKALWEMNHNSPAKVREWAPKVKDHPALLAWYGKDEPYEAEFDAAKSLSDTYHACDPNHPTYMVSCTPRLFPLHAELADVMAVDPYPYPRAPLTEVSRHADMAWDATRGERPVWQVLQSFGGEPEAVQRCMAYLAIAHGAKGLLWYPWNDGKSAQGQNVGLKDDPAGQSVIRRLCAEIRTLAPALLNPAGRRRFLAAEGHAHGLVCREPGGTYYLLLVNPEQVSADVAVDVPEAAEGSRLSGAFGTEAATLQGRCLSVSLPPYGVRAYTWRVSNPAP